MERKQDYTAEFLGEAVKLVLEQGGLAEEILSVDTRRSKNRASALLRLAAVRKRGQDKDSQRLGRVLPATGRGSPSPHMGMSAAGQLLGP